MCAPLIVSWPGFAGTRAAKTPWDRCSAVSTTSSTSLRLTSWRRCSGADVLGHMLEVDANTIPGCGAAAHLIHEHIGRLEVFRDTRVPLLPSRQAGQRFLLILACADFDQRILLRPRSRLGRLHARWLTRLLAVVRWPRRIPLPFLLLARG